MSKDCLKIWFCTDIHGSNACFRHFLRLFDIQKPTMRPNVMIIGGDITGKELIPIKQVNIIGGKRYEYINHDGKTKKVPEEGVEEELNYLRDGGKYPILCSHSEYLKLDCDPNFYKKRLDDERKKRVEQWMKLLKEKSKEHPDVQIYINCGNDDPLYLDKLLGDFRPEGKVIKLKANVKLLSLGYSNMTPWECPRDVQEEVLRQKIAKMTEQIDKNDVLVFNFHCPPLNTSFDEVYEVDKSFQKSNNKIHVGSSSVRDAIETYKPILSLHGHIHEVSHAELLGPTLCVNPGSNYQNGILKGAYFIIDGGRIIKYILIPDLFHEKASRSIKDILNGVRKALPFIKFA